MSNQLKEEKITRAREALEMARSLRRSRREMGVDGIRQFVKDVDGDWLENWSSSSHTENIPSTQQVLKDRSFLYCVVYRPNRHKKTRHFGIKDKFKSLVGTLKGNH
jgi:hypothetical protein